MINFIHVIQIQVVFNALFYQLRQSNLTISINNSFYIKILFNNIVMMMKYIIIMGLPDLVYVQHGLLGKLFACTILDHLFLVSKV